MKRSISINFLLLQLVCCIGCMAASAFIPPSHRSNQHISILSSNKNGVYNRNIISKPKPYSAVSALQASLIPGTESPRTLVSKGMQSFREHDVPASLSYFNKADDAVSNGRLTPYLWQRGISYYYLDKFKEGSDQFRLDVSVNPLDVEEIVWDIACLARMDNSGETTAQFPPEKRMALPKGQKDRRKIMGTVYSLYRGDGATEEDLRQAGHDGSVSDEFYSLFYLGLYCEIRNETSKAEMYMKAAASSPYATGNGAGDYMSACAKVHCRLRGWV